MNKAKSKELPLTSVGMVWKACRRLKLCLIQHQKRIMITKPTNGPPYSRSNPLLLAFGQEQLIYHPGNIIRVVTGSVLLHGTKKPDEKKQKLK